MRIAIGQFNATVGAFDQNVTRAVELGHQAAAQGAELLLLPEQAIPGYPARDFLQEPDFIAANERALAEVAARTSRDELAILVGFAAPHGGGGAGLYNAAALVSRGEVLDVAHKILLPTYDVFDEARYFDPGERVRVVEHHGVMLGLTVCEDIWNDGAFWPMPRYERDPVAEAVEAGAQIILNVSASPFSLGKPQVRERMLGACARHHGVPIVYCNLVGGNESLIFDGASLVIRADGSIQARGKSFEEELLVVEVEPAAARGASVSGGGGARVVAAAEAEEVGRAAGDRLAAEGTPAASSDPSHGAPAGSASPPAPAGPDLPPAPPLLGPQELDSLEAALVLGLRDYVRKSGFERVVLGLSGGLDSAVTAALAVRALGGENVLGVAMPSRFTAQISTEDASALARNLGIRLEVVPVEAAVQTFEALLAPVFGGGISGLTQENLQARSRGLLLMGISNETGALLLTTGNKSELAVGYCTLYGDMAGGIAILGDLPKTMVYALAWHLNRGAEVIPERTITRPPSAELREDQTDQDSLPPYEVLDRILHAYVIERRSVESIVAGGEDEAVVRAVLALVLGSEFKRKQAAFCLKVSPRAFGLGWRYPLAHGYRPAHGRI